MIVFISGGAKNGKTTLGQDLAVKLSAGGPHYYVATMIPADDEDRERIRRHIEDRDGMGFETIEVGRGILSCLEKADSDATFLLDSVIGENIFFWQRTYLQYAQTCAVFWSQCHISFYILRFLRQNVLIIVV
jgi:adenosylcobinamide kinase/adenosylcobinamide-phosphate guanylyltransferase